MEPRPDDRRKQPGRTWLSLLALGLVASCEALPSSEQPPPRVAPSLAALPRLARGTRVPLASARMFVPADLVVPASGVVPVFVHFKGAPALIEELFVRVHRPGILISSTLSGFSSAFKKPYEDPEAFRSLLRSAEQQLRRVLARDDVHLGAITITFFSAGYGAVRELLKHDDLFARIQTLVSADSIYASLAGESPRTPDAAQMAGFVRFARAAVRNEKTFVLAHSEIATPYASTRDTADWLLAAVSVERRPATGYTRRGVPIATAAHAGGFYVYGFAEADARIHVDILWMLDELVRAHVPGGPTSGTLASR